MDDLKVERLDHLGIISGVIKDLGLIERIDERIVLALPLCLAVRFAYHYQLDRKQLRPWIIDVLLISAGFVLRILAGR